MSDTDALEQRIKDLQKALAIAAGIAANACEYVGDDVSLFDGWELVKQEMDRIPEQ